MPYATSHVIIPDSDSESLQTGERFSCARTEVSSSSNYFSDIRIFLSFSDLCDRFTRVVKEKDFFTIVLVTQIEVVVALFLKSNSMHGST